MVDQVGERYDRAVHVVESRDIRWEYSTMKHLQIGAAEITACWDAAERARKAAV
jgi:hypothetical protein